MLEAFMSRCGQYNDSLGIHYRDPRLRSTEKMTKFLSSALVFLLTPALFGSELLDRAKKNFEPIPSSVPTVEGRSITPEKVELGKMLFFDARLSRSWLISCNTCHNLATGGVDLMETAIGHGWAQGPRNSPTVLNAVFNMAQFWDGRAKDLQEQAKGPVQAAVEMNSTPSRTVETLKSIPGYVDAFEAAFPGDSDAVNYDNMAAAIEAFESTLLTPSAPFDQYLRGDESALNAHEKQGLTLFLDKGCVACHNGVNVGGAGYFPFGVVEKPGAEILPPNDKGRFEVTKTVSDEYKFKSPSLRNIDLTPPYFHSGRVWDLKLAVAVMGSSQLGATLSDDDVDAIVAFLRTLTGRQPQIELPILPPQTSRTPLPEPQGMTSAGH